jgi:hypothetical protein
MAAKTTTAPSKKKAAKKATTAKKPAKKPAKKAAKKSAAAKAPSKKAAKKAPAGKAPAGKAPAGKARAKAAGANPPATRKPSKRKVQERSVFLPRAVASVDDDNPLMAHGGGGGGFGRCGGRLLSNRLEQQLCHRLGIAGVVHSHSPRHYEIRFDENKVAAYAPMIVLRGRGREGKGVIIEAVEDPKAAILTKITAFRAQYGQEFYIILVADEDSLDEIPLSCYDESCSSNSVHNLIARLAE